jgi:transcriptional regulator with XRE-family HTH domain
VDELPIGRRVAYWRTRRKMSQQVFADRLGKSKSWVDKVERGVRRLDKFSVVHEMADVLQVDAQMLLGRAPERRPESASCVDQVEVEEIRAALERYDQINGFFHPPAEPPVLAEMHKAVGHAWLTYQHAKYGVLARALPRLLRDAQAADNAYAGTDGAGEAAHLLGQVHQVASSSLRKLGEYQLAWLAADRSMSVARRTGDQLLAGTASFRIGLALLALGRSRPALEVNVNLANRLAPASGEATPQRLSVYGMLLLQGAVAAARIGDSATTRDLLDEADQAAAALGGDQNHYWTCFGPTNVRLHRVAAAIELGDAALAVKEHDLLDPAGFAGLLPERRAHHFLDMARGYAQIGDVDRAGEMLMAADRLAPSEVRCRPIAHEVLTDVLRRSHGAPPAGVTELAEDIGIGV